MSAGLAIIFAENCRFPDIFETNESELICFNSRNFQVKFSDDPLKSH